MELIEKSMHE
jgi:hypothetical protein